MKYVNINLVAYLRSPDIRAYYVIQHGLLPQTDRASAFVSKKNCKESVVDRIKIFLTSSLITTQNSVAVSHAVCALVKGPKIMGCGSLPLGIGRG